MMLNTLFRLADDINGVILEPLPEGSTELSLHWSLIAIAIVMGVMFLLAWLVEDVMPVVFGFILSCIIGFLFTMPYYEEKDMGLDIADEENAAAELLTKHYGVEVTRDQIHDAKLLSTVGKDQVKEIPYLEQTVRDPKTGEWARENRSFLVDGKVVEILVEYTPTENRVAELKKDS